MAKHITRDEYVVSERVTITKGDVFKARGGPYYVSLDARGRKTRVSMAARGPFVFVRLVESGRRKWIEAISTRDGTAAVLSLTRRRSILPGALIPRPYVVVGKAGRRRRRADEASQDARPARRRAGGRRRPASPEIAENLAAPENPICPIDTPGQ